MTTAEELLADVHSFLNTTLNGEDLSFTANQQRLLLLEKICAREPYVDMTRSFGCHRPSSDFYSSYEEVESSCSGDSGTSLSNTSTKGSSSTLPSNGKHQRFSFLFSNSLGESKNKETNKSYTDTTDFPNDFSNRNSVLSDSDNSLSPPSVKSEDSIEIMTIAPSALKYSAAKCGHLYKKEKVLFVEHTKRVWVALLGTTLYIYTSEKDTKPIHNINVDEYNARPIAVSQSNKKEFGFEIIRPGKKTYQFYAGSTSEMDTWIKSINHSMPLPQTSVIPSSNGPPSCVESLDSRSSDCNEGSCKDSYRHENWNTLFGRELPSLPPFFNYDIPDPKCRAVTQDTSDIYDSIEEALAHQLPRYDYPRSIHKDSVLRNKENFGKNYNFEDNVYYNIPDHVTKINQIKNEDTTTPTDQTEIVSIQNEDNLSMRNSNGRIHQIIQMMEELINNNNNCNKKTNQVTNNVSKLTPVTTPIKEDTYELVNSLTYVNTSA